MAPSKAKRASQAAVANQKSPPLPANAIPQPLPPSVEEAYRRKCCQLRHRRHEVEEANDAARTRLYRLKRQIEKLRLERAFLLEQLAKRTSTNVEDSDGSPSPPPTPKDKPLRTKRGHRKPGTFPDGEGKSTAVGSSQNLGLSPASESFSHANDTGKDTASRSNGTSQSAKRPANAFELYCKETRPSLKEKEKDKDSDINIEEELARGWKDLPEAEKEEYQSRQEKELAKYQKNKESRSQKKKSGDRAGRRGSADANANDTEPEPDQDQDQDHDAEIEADGTEQNADKDAEMKVDKDEEDDSPKGEDTENKRAKDKNGTAATSPDQDADPGAEMEIEKDADNKSDKGTATQDEDVEMADDSADAKKDS